MTTQLHRYTMPSTPCTIPPAPCPRSLAEKIRVARVNKERADQVVEKKVLQGQQAEYDRWGGG